MMQRTILTLATAITAFVIALAGGVAAYLATQPRHAAAPTATAVATIVTTAPEPGLDPTAVQNAINQRDAAYQQRMEQANRQLQLANQQLSEAYQKQQELASQLSQSYQQQRLLAGKLKQAQQAPPAPIAQPRQAAAPVEPTATPAPVPPAPAYAISADAASRLALSAAPGATLSRAPELVSFQGVVAYEVLLDRGAVYVDANSGQILYNGAAIAVASGGGGEHHEGDEHEGDGED
jgi:uncharacterized membrane protein YkoI